MWIVSVILLSAVVLLCALGVYHHAFKDNFIQCVGMCWLGFAYTGRIHYIIEHEYVDPAWALIHVGVFIYAVGTAWKVIIHHGREARWPILRKYDDWVLFKRSDMADFDLRPHHHNRRIHDR